MLRKAVFAGLLVVTATASFSQELTELELEIIDGMPSFLSPYQTNFPDYITELLREVPFLASVQSIGETDFLFLREYGECSDVGCTNILVVKEGSALLHPIVFQTDTNDWFIEDQPTSVPTICLSRGEVFFC